MTRREALAALLCLAVIGACLVIAAHVGQTDFGCCDWCR